MRPKVLLLGNGLNRSFSGDQWGDLLKQIHCNHRVSLKNIEKVDYPLQAVLATNDNLSETIRKNNNLFYGIESIEELRPMMERILSIPFDHILTTNYSYEIERVANQKVSIDGAYCQKLARHTKGCKRVESKYLLHTYNEVEYKGHKHKVWHIHGEARKTDSIILGHYYYGQLLSKCNQYLDKSGKRYTYIQNNGGIPPIDSWLDAFILGDVYVLGFGFGLCEMDLWWLMCRKKRENAKHGRTILYEPSFGNEIKETLFATYDGNTENLNYRMMKPDYKQFYSDAIEVIERDVRKM